MIQQQWRLIPLLEASGMVQMAIDRWLLQQHREKNHPPTLRFYTWSPVAISLGYHQRHYPQFWHDLTWQGNEIEIVRRPTGGRAVLHQGDLTYMVVTSATTGKRQDSYHQICQFLIQGWRSLGIELYYGATGRGYIHNPNCFGSATEADLIVSTREKLIGSAQLRQGKSLLQHGSMVLFRDKLLFSQVFGYLADQPLELFPHQPRDTVIQTVVKTLIESARQTWEIDFICLPLTPTEWKEILTLSSMLT